MAPELEVCYFYRTAGFAHSIERVFSDIRSALPASVRQHEFKCPFRRAEPIGMWRNGWRARRAAAPINHITGDVHYLAQFLPRRVLIITVHDVGHVMTLMGLKSRVYRTLWFDLPLRRAECVTFISDFSRRETERVLGFRIARRAVIPNPLSESFLPAPKLFPTSCPTVLTLGTGVNKNLPRLAEALQGLDVKLRIIGRPTEEQLERLAHHRVNFSWTAELSSAEVVEEYLRSDLVVMVSTYEGFGLPLIEAQAVGRPVISSAFGPMPEVAGDAAVLVDPHSPAAIREGLRRLVSDGDLRARLVAAGFENVRRFSKERVAAHYLALYRETAERAAAPRGTN